MSKKLKTEYEKHQTNRGFTIFLAVLVASLALAVGVAIYDLTVRELDLTIAARESQYAVYAADSGTECALYWDSKYSGNNGSAFATSTTDTQIAGSASNVICNGQNIVAGSAPLNQVWTVTTTGTAATTTFQFSMGGVGGSAANPCATVLVTKSGNPQQTAVISNGFNNCLANSPNRLERTIQVTY